MIQVRCKVGKIPPVRQYDTSLGTRCYYLIMYGCGHFTWQTRPGGHYFRGNLYVSVEHLYRAIWLTIPENRQFDKEVQI